MAVALAATGGTPAQKISTQDAKPPQERASGAAGPSTMDQLKKLPTPKDLPKPPAAAASAAAEHEKEPVPEFAEPRPVR